MVFSSSVFLFLFLPVVLLAYALVPWRLKNLFLLAASIFFYAWGETYFVLIMLGSIMANYVLGLFIDRLRASRVWARSLVALAVLVNLGLLAAFKYANFFVDNVNVLLQAVGLDPVVLGPVHLPIGISFFTFQALTYVVDVYRGSASVQRNPINVATYIALFPQLIAGPIVRYADIARELGHRVVTLDLFASGVRRFVVGLAKKMLIANVVAVPADKIFGLPAGELTTSLAWLGVLCYALQIYFDFSGYSDMAIGLGRMFGFHFLENFNYPYTARSMRDFWQRWHISLSTWFRDYLYIPLGGSRCRAHRVYFNLVVVFFLCGLWHGASWNFIAWGLFHGAFLVAERVVTRRIRFQVPVWGGHVYVLLVVLVSWVLFRAETLSHAMRYLAAMAGLAGGAGVEYYPALYLHRELLMVSLAGVMGSMPIIPSVQRRLTKRMGWTDALVAMARLGGVALLLFASAMKLAAGTHNPFIYFRF